MTPVPTLLEAATAMVRAIDRKWEGESTRKRENAFSPNMEEALDTLRWLVAEEKGNGAE